MGRKNKRNERFTGKKDGRCTVYGKFIGGYERRCNSCKSIIKIACKESKLHYDTGESEKIC